MEYLSYLESLDYSLLPYKLRIVIETVLVLGLLIYFTVILFNVIVGYRRKRKSIDIQEEVEGYKVWNLRSNNEGIMMVPNLNRNVRYTEVKRLYFTFRVRHESETEWIKREYDNEFTLCILVVGIEDFSKITVEYNKHYNRNPSLSVINWLDTIEVIDRLSMREVSGINEYIKHHGVNKLFSNILVIPETRESMVLRLLSKVRICLGYYTVKDAYLFRGGLRNSETFCTHLLQMLNVNKLDMISWNGLKDSDR